ncbi:hypothetical protein L228DRAFT_259527 [Xylona heveae TC161]|uniref:Amidohydrolase-related domain-containing protein n=1 Tax=Xylona heveae (strain CBS 132557 / TC161) TaxID=1328760 RepID=A0A165I2Q3_XYLHT|nr:hypothetical protein L228DRAFT_259527 [Xylona heveae TC161]KZF24288.1 hypothetical protein L228DRAFT_259527 [Xylona heveae TC161]
MTTNPTTIIDSHIHLFPSSELPSLNWWSPGCALDAQHSMDEYLAATGNPAELRGYVFLEADRRAHVRDESLMGWERRFTPLGREEMGNEDEDRTGKEDDMGKEDGQGQRQGQGQGQEGWQDALTELDFIARVVRDMSRPGEGHGAGHGNMCVGIVPWAPLPLGVNHHGASGKGEGEGEGEGKNKCKKGRKLRRGPDLETYLACVRARCAGYSDAGSSRVVANGGDGKGYGGGGGGKDVFGRIKGFRYLVQDKPAGVLLTDEFIEGVKWLGRKGYAFDLGVDQRQGGIWQLHEAVEMLERVMAGEEDEEKKTKIVINHLCKPNMRIDPANAMHEPSFLEWRELIQRMASFPTTYMKLSGGFAELPPQEIDKPWPVSEIVAHIQPWFDVAMDAFGPSRIMFGSDWPVCNAGGAGTRHAWKNWRATVALLLEQRGVTEEEARQVWSGTAIRAYGLEL